jgi:hypothetical protein
MNQKQAWQKEQEADKPMTDDDVINKAWVLLQDKLNGNPLPVDYYIHVLGFRIQVSYYPEYAELWPEGCAWLVDLYASSGAGVVFNNTHLPH